MDHHTDTAPEDLLWEVSLIAHEINRTERQTYHMLKIGAIPARKVGGKWVASRRQLRAALISE